MLILGQGSLLGIVGGRGGDPLVHGQPLLPGGGGGRSFRLGQCILLIPHIVFMAHGFQFFWFFDSISTTRLGSNLTVLKITVIAETAQS